uniref:Uncharacterized protein n=1 Tax=Eutreptiella gymnastica TaxID=73025 RepID=A0A7S1ILC7_9EUGL
MASKYLDNFTQDELKQSFNKSFNNSFNNTIKRSWTEPVGKQKDLMKAHARVAAGFMPSYTSDNSDSGSLSPCSPTRLNRDRVRWENAFQNFN